MKDSKTFKERVKETIIRAAENYKNYFVEYDYLLCSEAFMKNKYYIIKGEKSNFKHLTGVLLVSNTAEKFYDKSLDGTLEETDFEIVKDVNDKFTKGTIRRKISVIEDAVKIFEKTTFVEEDFEKNNIKCSIATEDSCSTIGFTSTGSVVRPKTLLKGDQLDKNKAKCVELVLRRKRNEKYFNEIVIGDKNAIDKYENIVLGLVDDSLFDNIK